MREGADGSSAQTVVFVVFYCRICSGPWGDVDLTSPLPPPAFCNHCEVKPPGNNEVTKSWIMMLTSLCFHPKQITHGRNTPTTVIVTTIVIILCISFSVRWLWISGVSERPHRPDATGWILKTHLLKKQQL